MPVEKDYSTMTAAEVNAEIKRLKDELEDLEDTFTFNLTNTSAHLRSGIVAEHEEEIEELNREIATLRTHLDRMEG